MVAACQGNDYQYYYMCSVVDKTAISSTDRGGIPDRVLREHITTCYSSI